jgi:hypothetical protein
MKLEASLMKYSFLWAVVLSLPQPAQYNPYTLYSGAYGPLMPPAMSGTISNIGTSSYSHVSNLPPSHQQGSSSQSISLPPCSGSSPTINNENVGLLQAMNSVISSPITQNSGLQQNGQLVVVSAATGGGLNGANGLMNHY